MFERKIDNDRVRLIFEGDIPLEVFKPLIEIFDCWGDVVPTICDEIRVFYTYDDEDEDPEVFAACESLSEYRAARIHIYPRWLTEAGESRERIIVHELGHIITAPLAEMADFVAEKCSGDKLVVELIAEQNRRACESTVTDLEKILWRTHRHVTGSTTAMQ